MRDSRRIFEVTGGLAVTIGATGAISKWATATPKTNLWGSYMFVALVVLAAVGVVMFFIGVLGLIPRRGLREVIAIDVPNNAFLWRPAGTGWLACYQAVRVTNSSQVEKMSLDLRLHVTLPDGVPRVLRENDQMADVYKTDGLGVQWLRCPLHLAPATTATGYIGFLLPFTLWDALDANDQSVIFPHQAQLEITNHVGGKTIMVTVPGRHP